MADISEYRWAEWFTNGHPLPATIDEETPMTARRPAWNSSEGLRRALAENPSLVPLVIKRFGIPQYSWWSICTLVSVLAQRRQIRAAARFVRQRINKNSSLPR